MSTIRMYHVTITANRCCKGLANLLGVMHVYSSDTHKHACICLNQVPKTAQHAQPALIELVNCMHVQRRKVECAHIMPNTSYLRFVTSCGNPSACGNVFCFCGFAWVHIPARRASLDLASLPPDAR